MKRLKKKNHSLLITNIILGALCFFIAFAVTTKVLDRFAPKEIRITPYIDIDSETQIKTLYSYCNFMVRPTGQIKKVNKDLSQSDFDATTNDSVILGRKVTVCYPMNSNIKTAYVVRNMGFLLSELKKNNDVKNIKCDVKEICDGISISD